MKYYEIKEKLKSLVVFTIQDLIVVEPEFRMETLYEWENKGLVTKLRNKKYIFGDFNPANEYLYFIANKIYSNSYISLEMALNHYGIIPELVLRYTSVTTNKTLSIKTKFGIFDYRTISKKLFFGYELIKWQDIIYKIATLEKALLDYLYLHSEINSEEDFESLRFNKGVLVDKLDREKMNEMLDLFQNEALNTRVEQLYSFIQS